ncbi:xanthine and CO dehydrogenases maturation factor, XdhC/CoxF family [Schinkia azotoformans MEV2011]|uniref:Xanthine and CO dehydrogenases maturation factor, XdhC/CoxF family n=2 Tax=Schinkia azotoformans TaxID=1454 RepID=A0A072NNI9_SCHAZ|nr:xanthine and CO dehydrogenases maturation factor, XdhC/CoxF family [Schinkia azotoformans MEV2011]
METGPSFPVELKNMQNLLRILEVVQNSTEKWIIATIINVDGSAYLKEGTLMLISESGQTVGMISPGCLEEDLVIRCKELFLSKRPQTVTYDLRSIDDIGWGQGIGCNGVLTILLEPIDEKLRKELLFLKNSLENGKTVLHEKEFSNDSTLKSYSFEIDHGQEIIEKTNITRIQEGFKYTNLFTPPPVLLIFGAGEDAKPLVTLAAKIGFFVNLCDWRPGLCNEYHFPSANQYYIGGYPQKIMDQITLSKNDFVVIMSHNFSKDEEFLKNIINYDVRYIGILGSETRTKRLLKGKEYKNNLYYPIGLSIGAEGSEEIAVSIMAEIIQIFRRSHLK